MHDFLIITYLRSLQCVLICSTIYNIKAIQKLLYNICIQGHIRWKYILHSEKIQIIMILSVYTIVVIKTGQWLLPLLLH